MPYIIEEKHKGCFAVKDPKHPKHKFSMHCQTRKQAQKQRVAIALSESRKTGKSPSMFFK